MIIYHQENGDIIVDIKPSEEIFYKVIYLYIYKGEILDFKDYYTLQYYHLFYIL
jgi:hypothetical protein